LRVALLASTALSLAAVLPAAAQDAIWLANPGSGDFNTGGNWSTGSVPTGTASFDTSSTTALSFSANTTIGGFTFNAGASNYTFTNATETLVVNGAGIVVNGGSASITNNGGFVFFQANSTAGSAAVTNNSIMNFGNTSTAGSASITNNAVLTFSGSGTGGSATVTNSFDMRFFGTSTAGNAAITSNFRLWFLDAGTAGNAAITNSRDLTFFATSTAGNATIANNGTSMLNFNDTSTAGGAIITNNNSSTLNFDNTSTAGSATITNSSSLNFLATSTAGSAVINNNSASINFLSSSTAGTATINNNFLGLITFQGTSTGGSATINNQSSVLFRTDSTAGAATITSNGFSTFLTFELRSTAGNATIITEEGARVQFANTSTGGNARFITNVTNGAIASFNMSGLTASGMTAGSIEGSGNYVLGAKALTVGSNNLSTEVSGVISGTAGSLIKTGSGTLTLSGTNTYTGATTVNGGTLALSGAGSIATSGGVANNGVFDISATTSGATIASLAGGGSTILGARQLTVGSNNLSTEVSGVISGTGGSLIKTGTGTLTLSGANTYSGGTTITDGTLQLGTAGSMGSIVGAVTVGGTGTFDVTNAGTSGITGITNAGVTNFNNSMSAGSATIINNNPGTLNFNATSTAGTSAITNNRILNFNNSSSAGSATITNNAGSFVNFNDTSTAGNATITSRNMSFNNSSSAGSANITSNFFLQFHNTSTAGSAAITNNDTVNFNDTSSAGSATITNNGPLRFNGSSTGGTARFINGAGGTIDLSWLSAAGTAAGSIEGAGTIALSSKNFEVGGNDLSTTFSGALQDGGGTFGGSGGSLTKTGVGTLTLSGTNTYTGATVVNGGTLAVNSSLTATSGITVNSGGALGGTGTVGNTTIASGGALAPGNSIGTIIVNGNLTFNAGGFYTVEVSPTAADRTNVTGTATLTGATVQAVALPGSFRSQTYTILNATGGFGGTQFAGLTGSTFAPGARNPHLTYDTNNVYLVLDPGTIQLPAGTSGNQSAVAGGINKAVESGATPPAAFDVLLNMSGSQLTNALNQVSGQPSTGAATSATQMTTSFMTLLLNPNGGAVGGTTFGGARSFASEPALSPEAAEAYAAVTPKDKKLAVFAEPRWSVWGQVYGGYNKTEGDSADTTARTWGLATGFDYRVAPGLTLGFALAGGSMNWGLSEGLGGGKSEVMQIGAYGRKEFGPAYLSAALSYAWHGMSTDRTVTVSGTDKLTASFNAHSFGGRIETGTRFATRWVGVTPYAALQVQNFRTPSYRESAVSGSNAFELTYDANSTTSTRTELGAWFDNTIALDRGNVLALRSRAAWARDHSSNTAMGAAFQTLPGSSFTVNGAQGPANSLLTSLGAELRLANSWSIGGRFDGEFASRSQTYAGTGTVRYAW
jgi:autotransporter-associated beta strand protein